MGESYSKSIDYTKLVELASTYDRVELAKGNFKGKGTGALRNLETRLRVLSSLASKSQFAELDKVYDIIAEKEKSYYWRKVMKQPDRKLDECVSMAKIALQNELMPYTTNKEYATAGDKQEIKEGAALHNYKPNRYGRLSGKFVKTIATIATAGLVIWGAIGMGYNIRDKSAKDEIAKLKSQKQIVYVVVDKHPFEQEKVESNIASKSNLEDKLVEAEAESKKTEDKEIWGNRGYNKRDGKWTQEKEISENSRRRTESRLIDEQARDIRESTMLLWHEDVRRHPRANDRYNHIKGRHPFHYAKENLKNIFDYVFGDGPDIRQNLFGNEAPSVAQNYEVSLKEALITGDNKSHRVDGFISDLTSIGSNHKTTPAQMVKKTGDDAKNILPSAGKFLKNFFTLNWFGRRTKEGNREPGAIENLVDTVVYTVKTPLDAVCVPLQGIPIVDANGIVEDAYHGIRAVRGAFGSGAATITNASQGTVDGLIVNPTSAIIPQLGRGIDKTNLLIHDTAQFAATGVSQLLEAELIAENIDPQESSVPWNTNPEKADGAVYPYRMPTGMRYLYEFGKDIAVGGISAGGKGGKGGGIFKKPGRSGGAQQGGAGRSGGAMGP